MNRPKELLNIINDRISQLNFGNTPDNLYDPIDYIMGLGGKRLRPLLALLSYELFCEGSISPILDPAIAIETFHNFTLMHDDVMDQAPIRRGKPTVHEKWDINTAILSGDVMLVRTYDLFLNIAPSLLTDVIRRFNDCAARVCEGQQLDMNYETSGPITEDHYIEMIKLKTAALIGFSLELGAFVAGAGEKQVCLLKEFGLNVGIGFQLMDDLLDVYPGNAGFGKQLGGDIISNKKTYLLTKAVELADGELKEELNRWLSRKQFQNDEKIKSVTEIFDKLKVRQMTLERIDEYFKRGFTAFQELDVPQSKKTDLKEYVGELIHREK